jgi:3-hydroxyacyl-CoA dehydrogenase/enoyl-CoA hydratase/3-hydroxybutyryl-CoA epimerase
MPISQEQELAPKLSVTRNGKAEHSTLLLAPTSVTHQSDDRTVKLNVRIDQVCVLTFDRPGSAANIFDRRTLLELEEELEFIAGCKDLKGLVLTSAKPAIFIAGADLRAMSEASSEEIRELIELGQRVMNRLAMLPIPTVAAIHGAAVGGGYELCLACDYRVASTDRATKIGLPEIQLGLLPAWGGSTRLPRLVGLVKALDVILAGKTLAAKQARKCGMIDDLAPAEYLVDVAIQKLARGKRRLGSHWHMNNPVVGAVLERKLRSQLLNKTRGHYPAVLKALEVVTRGISKSIPQSLALERDGILELVQTETCRNLVRIFFLQEKAKKLALPVGQRNMEPPDVGCDAARPITLTSVIGAGVMGAGIAQCLSARRLRVILCDINTEQVAKGMASIAKLYQEGARRHVFTRLEARDGMDRIHPAPGEVSLRSVDLVIEAAVENLELKKKIFRDLDRVVGEDTILATNTSALPVSEIAAGTRRPDRVLGLHFFNPVHRMQLVEIVAAPQTSPEALQRALRFVQQIGKLPVIVKDSPGFLVNRILMPYLLGACKLFDAGASITDIDEAMLDFGMPMGPLRLLDEVGLDVALKVANAMADACPDQAVPESLNRMVQSKLQGRKIGSGFYLYSKGKASCPNPAIVGRGMPGPVRLERGQGQEEQAVSLQSRMVLLMVNEAARCIEEQIVRDPADVDFAMIMGTGFAPFRGGPLRYADSLGAAKVVDKLERLVQQGHPEFEPCALLRSFAAGEQAFYP